MIGRVAVLLASILFGSSAAARSSPLEIRSVTLTDMGGLVLFETVFDRAPDFFTVDQYGRNYDAFQLTLTHNMENPFLFRDVWIQGINIQNGYIPVYPMQRNGHFGPVSANVPYLVSLAASGHQLSFAVPYSALGSPDSLFPRDGNAGPGTGAFNWFLDTYQYGASPFENNHASGQYPVNVPEPGVLMQMGIGVGMGMLMLKHRVLRGKNANSTKTTC
jgi:hypothetical protein